MSEIGRRAARLAFRLLLLLLPRGFRSRHGADMQEVFLELGARDPSALSRRLLHEALDLARTGIRLRMERERRSHAAIPRSGSANAYLAVGAGTEVRHAARSLARKPGFTLLCVGTMVLGIAPGAVMFGVLDRLVLDPLPYAAAERMVTLWRVSADDAGLLLSPGEEQLTVWAAQTDVFESIEPLQVGSRMLIDAGDPRRVGVARVSPTYLGFLGVRPLLGRDLAEPDTAASEARVALIGHELWVERFGGDPSIVGRTVSLDGRSVTVVGVLPSRLPLPTGTGGRVDFLLPWDTARRYSGGAIVARLRPGVSPRAAQSRLDAIMAGRSEQDRPDWRGIVRRSRELFATGLRDEIRLLTTGVGLLLLVAWMNLAGILVVGAVRQQPEMSVRLALGAGRSRLVGQIVLQSVLVSLLSGVAAVGFGALALESLARTAAGSLEPLTHVAPTGRVAGFTLGMALTAGILASLLPALQTVRYTCVGARREARSPLANERLRSSLLVIEVALSVALVASAVFAFRTYLELRGREPGFNAAGVVALQAVPGPGAAGPARPDVGAGFQEAVRSSVGALRFVVTSARSSGVPTKAGIFVGGLRARGTAGADIEVVYGESIGAGYFDVLGQPLRSGRDFTHDEHRTGAPVVVLGERTAGALFPGGNAVGHAVMLGDRQLTVVGVAADVAQLGLSAASPASQMYVPLARAGSWIVLRARERTDERMLRAIRRSVLEVDPEAVVLELAGVDEMLAATLVRERLASALLLALALASVALAAVGLYGCAWEIVCRRLPEIGLRAAVGAPPASLRALVLRPAVRAVGLGICLGVVSVLSAGAVLGIPVPAYDSLLLAGAILAGVTLTACWGPARHASSVEALRALRSE